MLLEVILIINQPYHTVSFTCTLNSCSSHISLSFKILFLNIIQTNKLFKAISSQVFFQLSFHIFQPFVNPLTVLSREQKPPEEFFSKNEIMITVALYIHLSTLSRKRSIEQKTTSTRKFRRLLKRLKK
jgi:hypothetical protein